MGMKLEVTVPTSLKDISLKDYQEFIKISSDKELDDVFIRQKMVQIFCHIPLLAVNKMGRKDFISITNQIISILQEKPKLTKQCNLIGVDYGFIPNLSKDMTLGEFIDLDEYLKDWSSFHKAMSVLYRPITQKKGENYRIEVYDSDKVNDTEMLSMNMEVVMGAVLFFWTLSSQLLTITPKFLQQLLRKNQEAATALEKSGVGISTYINLLEEACLKLERLAPYTLELRSYS